MCIRDRCTDNNNCNISSIDNGNSNSNDSDNNNESCIDYNDDGMNIIKNSIRKGVNNTTIALSDDNSNDTSQIRLLMGSVCTPLFRLHRVIESYYCFKNMYQRI